MSVICPHCNSSFELMPMEEIINPTLTISRKIKERSSWEEIADVINRGEARRLFDIGDTISCTLKNGKDVNFIITAINPYQPNQVAFEFESSLPDTKVMNSRNTNRGGWAKSEMKEYMKEVFALLPDDLQKVIVPRKITQKLSDGSQNSSEDNYLWLRSITESGRQYEADIGDVAFPYFTGWQSRVKSLGDETYYYWLRSPDISYATTFWIVTTNGYVYHGGSASNSYGVCPCFFIGGEPNA